MSHVYPILPLFHPSLCVMSETYASLVNASLINQSAYEKDIVDSEYDHLSEKITKHWFSFPTYLPPCRMQWVDISYTINALFYFILRKKGKNLGL